MATNALPHNKIGYLSPVVLTKHQAKQLSHHGQENFCFSALADSFANITVPL